MSPVLAASLIQADSVILYDPFVSEEEFAAAVADIAKIRFCFGAISTDPQLPIWRGNIEVASVAVQAALRALRRFTGRSFDLVSCHVNLQTHGLDGAFHTDAGDPAGVVTHALNWYVHTHEWPKEFNGYLILGEDIHDLRAVLPTRNSAILFPAEIPHCATSPSVRAGALARMSLALKLRLRDEVHATLHQN
ncbi:MAG: hypothetical protein ACRD7E_15545 [Bryobacteraceae bacterium]